MDSKLHVAWASIQQRIQSQIFKETHSIFAGQNTDVCRERYVQMCQVTKGWEQMQKTMMMGEVRWYGIWLLLLSILSIINGFLFVEEIGWELI